MRAGSKTPTTKSGESYTAKDIYVLEGLEPVRKRPGMYIGSTGVDGLHHLIWEVLDNSIDEAMAGYAKNVAITLLGNNKVMVIDDGRGIPVETHKQTKKSALETVMTTLHAGAKFGGESYKVSGGLHGVGVSVVNALSIWMKTEVCRDGYQYAQEYSRGKPKYAVKKTGKCRGSGTAVTFEPDPEVFEKIQFDWERILDHIRQQAYLTKGVKISVIDRREGGRAKDNSSLETQYSFYFEGGIISYIQYLNRNEAPKHENIFYVSKEAGIDGKKLLVEAAFQYTDDLQGKEVSFANNIHTGEGGMHLTGFRTALTRALNDYARKNEYFKKDDETLTGDDVREGITAIISVKLREPQFEGQTKAKLGNPEARTAVETVVGESVKEWLEKYPRDAQEIIGKALLAQKARKAAKAARDTVLRKGAFEGLMLPGKLADCQSRNPEESELFLVEGDSAGGCFSGDTKIALLDGRNLSFRELIPEARAGKKHYCYTMRNDGSINIAQIVNPRLTKSKAEVIKIILDNDEEIVCTTDHKFMLADGSFKEARCLQPQDSLMPLYRQFSKLGGRITIKGYEMVYDPLELRWIFTHLLSDRYNLEHSTYLESDGAHRHHKDFNKLNNNPENIIRLTDENHLELHRRLAKMFLHRPEIQAKATATKRTATYREMARQKTLEKKGLFSRNAKKQWENDTYKQYMLKKFLEFYRTHEEYRKKNNQLLDKIQKKYWADEKNREKQALRTKEFFITNPDRKIRLAEIAKQQWRDEKLLRWRASKTRGQWTPEFRVKRYAAYNQTYLRKALEVLRQIYDKYGSASEQKYNEIRQRTGDRNLIRLSTVCQRFFENDQKKLTEAVINYNHKVKKVIPLAEHIDVYDLEVPETHNFALASGVFVHNSAKQGRDRKFQAILPLRGKILNVEKARLDKMLASKEIKSLIIALGAAIGDEFDESRLRYHRTVIMTDADVDGAHIRTLLLTLFYRYFPIVVERGYLYIAQPPLYRIQSGRVVHYAYSDAEKDKLVAEFKKQKLETKRVRTEAKGTEVSEEVMEETKGIIIQRYKGLGEMNPSQLWETTMDPQIRTMKQVTLEDATEADRIFDILMGDEVLPRKKFIQTHAKAVKNLDI
ncbi:MAG: DNA topoisomerase (ATP-hydrolyzing) subunit B [Candidatus Sungiibacteriota bacterium]|uniref:DNA topoisomerase (ATP-hydrolyzing) n=1 Tax=Candidatus Sungiibacteriota bacterium TaxID=2750080 RepID=A0A7T5UQF2_9BACT|nr:MAG: DNA topoisomerase (ATP-hydrolyzing) subunit B [Candidatus Sungbacteria bacterium]